MVHNNQLGNLYTAKMNSINVQRWTILRSLNLERVILRIYWPRGPMDKASDFESEDCEFESHRGQGYFVHLGHSTRRVIFT